MHAGVAFTVSLALLQVACALSVLPSRSERAARFLQTESQRLDSAELLQLGNHVRLPGDLDNVKKMIANMIVRHQAAQAEDTDHKSFCDKEMVAAKAKLEKLKMDLQKRSADQDLHTAQLAQLKDSISDLNAAIVATHKDKQKAARLRESEAATFAHSKAEADKTVLELRRQLRSDSEEQRKAAQQMQEDISLKQVKAENKEDDAQFTYKKLDGELAVAIATKTKQIEQKERKVISMTHEVSLGEGDFKMAKEEQAAAMEYNEKIQSSCTVRQDPAKDRKRNRQEQISSMKEAYNILSGEDIPR